MIDELYADLDKRMDKTVESVRVEFSKIRTGKASPALLDTVNVDYYGNPSPLKQVATIATPEPRLITIQPWEKGMLGPIEKAILASELGVTPNNDGNIIRIPIPPLTEERRKDLVKLIKKFGEEGKVAVRNIRREGNDKLKKAEKKHEISEDNMHDANDRVQKLTDAHTETIDKLVNMKEEEVMEV
jgi:ribosome recycling factor